MQKFKKKSIKRVNVQKMFIIPEFPTKYSLFFTFENWLHNIQTRQHSTTMAMDSSYLHQQSIQAPPFNLDIFLQKHLRFTKKRIKYTREDLKNICLQAQFAFAKNNSALIEIPYLPIIIVGDIHGQWRDLLRMFSLLGVPGKARYLFLGDYVDRGNRSLECICLLLALKVKYPTKIYMLRGNHECDYINYHYGFLEELKGRFSFGDAIAVFKSFNNLFDHLPLAALIVDRILCMHGGISPKLKTLDSIRKIRVPMRIAHNDQLKLDLLWSDPEKGIRGFKPNTTRACSFFFGADTVIKCCGRLGLDMILRGHQVMLNGYGFFARRHMSTIFTAPRYLDENMGAVVKISKDYQLTMHLLFAASNETKGKFEEVFEANKKGVSGDDVTEIEKMPDQIYTESQMGRILVAP